MPNSSRCPVSSLRTTRVETSVQTIVPSRRGCGTRSATPPVGAPGACLATASIVCRMPSRASGAIVASIGPAITSSAV